MNVAVVLDLFIAPDLDDRSIFERESIGRVLEILLLYENSLNAAGLNRNVVQPFWFRSKA